MSADPLTSRPGLAELLDELESFAKSLGRVEFLWERDDVVQTYEMENAQKEVSAARHAIESWVSQAIEEARKPEPPKHYPSPGCGFSKLV